MFFTLNQTDLVSYGSARALADDPLEVEPLHGLEEISAFAGDHQCPGEDRRRAPDELLEKRPALDEGECLEVAPVEPEQVERGVVEVSRPRT